MKKLFLLLLAATAQAVTLPLYIETDTQTVVSPDAPTTLAGYGIPGEVLPASASDGSFLVGDGAGGWGDKTGDLAQNAIGILNDNGQGVAIGFQAVSNNGVAVGNSADTTDGVAVGLSAESTDGVAIGDTSVTTTGASVGKDTVSTSGGAIGFNAAATDGFAGGDTAIASGSGGVQLGTGTNATDNTIQFLSSGSVTAAEFGRLSADTKTITAPIYTALATDGAILASSTIGATITLPVAASVPSSYRLSIKNIGSIGAITVDCDGGETIDGEISIILTTQYESVTLVTDGLNWFIL